MKIVTYNVNGLRPRIAQFGSLRKLLHSFDADIICFQETKLRRQELTADLVMADGYESFFSCTRTSEKGRAGYSGVATFCRVKSAFSSKEVALPVAAEEGITGLLENSQGRNGENLTLKEGLEDYSIDELTKVDAEGRCIVTDHGHFVLFNIYGPRAVCDDTERILYKHCFFKVLQKRWESLLSQGRRILVVGDFNIAPAAIDRCDAEPDFEKDEFRKWLRSMLVEYGGPFYDAFRAKHPERREAYTCWPQNTGAEIFNYGSRIDHILSTRLCLHQECDQQGHNFITCHVKECDILTQYSRWQPGNEPSYRWKGGRNVKLEGSDHAPVFMSLVEVPDIPQHNTPSLSSRYLPGVRGIQQTIVSVLMKRQVTSTPAEHSKVSSPISNESTASCCENLDSTSSYSNPDPKSGISEIDELSRGFTAESPPNMTLKKVNEHNKVRPSVDTRKKARKGQLSQLSLKSFFPKDSDAGNYTQKSKPGLLLDKTENQKSNHHTDEQPVEDERRSLIEDELCTTASPGDEEKINICSSDKEKKNVALMEWQRIQRLMQNSIPLCKGHKEPCVARVVKKPGPNYGRRFYVCARAEGPSSNPEANCNFFRWAGSKYGQK